MTDIRTHRITIDDVTDIDLSDIFECGQCFRWNDELGDGSYVGIAGEYLCHARLSGDRSGERSLILDVSDGDRAFWSEYFDLATDYSAIKRNLSNKEENIVRAIASCPGIRILDQDYYEVLISFIISQNNNIPRIKKCIEAMSERYGKPLGVYNGVKRYAFPEPEKIAALSPSDFEELRFGYRSNYLPGAARRYIDEGIPTGDFDEKRRILESYTGIGPKVANCVMLFGLRDVSAFPIDTWVRKLMADLYGFDPDDVRGMKAYSDALFGKYGGYAQQYLFHYYRVKISSQKDC